MSAGLLRSMPSSPGASGVVSLPVRPAARQRDRRSPYNATRPMRGSSRVAPGSGTIQVEALPNALAAQCENPDTGVAISTGQHASANRSATGCAREVWSSPLYR